MKLVRISLHPAVGEVRTYDFHPGLTVVDARRADPHQLTATLVGALGTGEAGVHVEADLDNGRAVVAFRPHGATHRVVDIETARDVSAPFRRNDGRIDLLGASGLEESAVTHAIVAGEGDLRDGDPTEAWFARLAGHDVETILVRAQAVVAAEKDLREATTVARANPGEAEAFERVANELVTATAAEKRHDRIRIATLVAGSALPLAAILGMNKLGNVGALTLIGASLALTVGCLLYERKLSRAVEAEREAVASAAIDEDTITERMANTPVGDPAVRQALLESSNAYQDASAHWTELAGTIPAPWVLTHTERLREMTRLKSSFGSSEVLDALATQPASNDLIAALAGRVAALTQSTSSRERLPLFLDDPLADLKWVEKAPVLEFLGRLASTQQVVLVTNDEETLGWARLEAMTGGVRVVDGIGTAPSEQPA